MTHHIIPHNLIISYNHITTPNHTTTHDISGSHLQLESPALEFVNAVTHVMGLDSGLTNEVASLKRLLLTQVKKQIKKY